MPETESLLARVPLFSSLPEREIHHLAETLTIRDVPSDTVLFYEGERRTTFLSPARRRVRSRQGHRHRVTNA